MRLIKFIPARLIAAAIGVLAQTTFALSQRAPAPSQELNTILMHATFEIYGPKNDEPGKTSFGTVFVMGKPRNNDPKMSDIVIVTAAHALDENWWGHRHFDGEKTRA